MNAPALDQHIPACRGSDAPWVVHAPLGAGAFHEQLLNSERRWTCDLQTSQVWALLR